MNARSLLLTLAALLVGVGAGFLIGRGGGSAADAAEPATAAPAADAAHPHVAPTAAAPQQSGISRTILRTVDDPAGASHEVVMGIAEIPPGARSGLHAHPGIEVGYVIDGSLVLEHHGREPETLTGGGHFYNDAPHDVLNTSDRPVKILAVWIVEKGKPLSSPVP